MSRRQRVTSECKLVARRMMDTIAHLMMRMTDGSSPLRRMHHADKVVNTEAGFIGPAISVWHDGLYIVTKCSAAFAEGQMLLIRKINDN